jgi:serine/threonine protein kinase
MFGVPPRFGRYRVQRQISAGATGSVFLGEDPETRTRVAIKTLKTFLPPAMNQLVVDDLTIVIGRLPTHSAILRLRAVGLEDQEPYLVSDVAPGESLDAALARFGPGAIVDILPRVRKIAEALDLASERGLCHAALHPRDVIVSEDSTVVTGIGIAEILGRRGAGLPVREPYVAPEIATEPPSNWSDQFSLAAITFEWLFGETIFGPAHSKVEVPALPDVDSDALSEVFTTALAPSPSARFESCRAFAGGLSAVVHGTPKPVLVNPVADTPVEPEPAPARVQDSPPTPVIIAKGPPAAELQPIDRGRRRFGLALAAMLLIGVALGFGGGYFASSPQSSSIGPLPAPPVSDKREVEDSRPTSVTPTQDSKAATSVPLAASAPSPPKQAAVTTGSVQPAILAKAPAPRSLGGGVVSDSPAKKTPRERTPSPPPRPLVAARPAAVGNGTLVIESQPPGAVVTVNGMRRGTTPLTIGAIPAGSYTVAMVLAKFQPVAMTVRVTAGERAKATASLTLVAEKKE